jgi:hypothetical protein
MTIGSRNATAAQKVALESRIRDLSRDISEAAAAFRAWLRDQDLNVQRLAGDVDSPRSTPCLSGSKRWQARFTLSSEPSRGS